MAPKSGDASEWFNKEGKLEYTLQNCKTDHDTCFNLENTNYPKQKGCGKLESLVEDLSYLNRFFRRNSTLNTTDIPIKKDECKKISGAANKKWKKAIDEVIKMMQFKEQETIPILDWNYGNDAGKLSRNSLKTLCTCSEDGCNGGNKMETKFYMPVITAFIFSKIFSS